MRLLLVILLLFLAVSSHARTWIVDQAGAGDFTRVRDALVAAAAGDSVLVGPGTYDESDGPNQWLILETTPLTLLGTGSSPQETSLRISILFRNSTPCHIENLRFFDEDIPLNFHPDVHGGQLVVRHCQFEGNVSGCGGGAINVVLGNLVAEDCEFTNNRTTCDYAPEYGSGGAINASRAEIRRCLFSGNEAGWAGGAIYCNSNLVLEDCVFFRNKADHGAAIMACFLADIRRCTFFANEIRDGTGAALESCGGNWGSPVSHCIVAKTINGWGVECMVGKTFECSDVWANENGDFVGMWCDAGEYLGNFSADPLFCDEANGDVGLLEGSPCLAGAHGPMTCGQIGAGAAECAGTPVEKMSWGRVRSLFR